MINKKGILEKKLETYYSDVNIYSYLNILNEAKINYKGKSFQRILDIGSGVGSFIEALKNYPYKVYALEGSNYGYATLLKKKVNVKKFFLENNKKLPFKDNYFSFVLMNQVIEHLDKKTGKFYVKEIIRVLEPGGVGIIKSPSKYSVIWNTDPHHVYCWEPNELFNEINKYSDQLLEMRKQRVVLEPWMFTKYNEKIINIWHKKNKFPYVKRFFYLIFKLLDKLINIFIKTDRLLSVANVTFVKKIK